ARSRNYGSANRPPQCKQNKPPPPLYLRVPPTSRIVGDCSNQPTQAAPLERICIDLGYRRKKSRKNRYSDGMRLVTFFATVKVSARDSQFSPAVCVVRLLRAEKRSVCNFDTALFYEEGAPGSY